jgi:hypothetical protein
VRLDKDLVALDSLDLVNRAGWYNSTAYNGTTKVAGMGAINAGFKKELNRNAGILQLSVTDLLSTIRYNAYSRPFGSNSPKAQKAPGSETQDEQGRVIK